MRQISRERVLRVWAVRGEPSKKREEGKGRRIRRRGMKGRRETVRGFNRTIR